MGTGITGIPTFSGLVAGFELAAQYGVLTDDQEVGLRKFHDHTDGQTVLPAQLRKIHGPHGTPDVSRHAAVRFSSDGSRATDPGEKAPVLKLAGQDDSDGEGRRGPTPIVAGMRLVVLAPGSMGADLLTRTLQTGGFILEGGDFSTISGVARFLQSEAVSTQTLIHRLPAGSWKATAQKLYKEAHTQGENLGAFCDERNNLNIEGCVRAAMTLISGLQNLANTLPEIDNDATHDPFTVALEALSEDVFTVVDHTLDHASTYDFRDDSLYVKNPATLDPMAKQLTEVLHTLFDAGTSGAAERFEDELTVAVNEMVFQARLSPDLRRDYAAFKESLEFLATARITREADLVAFFTRMTGLVKIYDHLWKKARGSETMQEVLIEFWPTVQDHLGDLLLKLQEAVIWCQSRRILQDALLAIYDQVIQIVEILMEGLSHRRVLFSTQEETDLLQIWYSYPQELAQITGQSIFRRQVIITGKALWQRLKAAGDFLRWWR